MRHSTHLIGLSGQTSRSNSNSLRPRFQPCFIEWLHGMWTRTRYVFRCVWRLVTKTYLIPQPGLPYLMVQWANSIMASKLCHAQSFITDNITSYQQFASRKHTCQWLRVRKSSNLKISIPHLLRNPTQNYHRASGHLSGPEEPCMSILALTHDTHLTAIIKHLIVGVSTFATACIILFFAPDRGSVAFF